MHRAEDHVVLGPDLAGLERVDTMGYTTLELLTDRDIRAYPGGQLRARPPRRWKCKWKTDWPPSLPMLVTTR